MSLGNLFQSWWAGVEAQMQSDASAEEAVRKAARALAEVALKKLPAGKVRDAAIAGIQDAVSPESRAR